MRRLALAIALTCVLSGMGHAGEIHTTGAVAPPPPPSTVTAAGEIPTTGSTAPGEISSTSAPQESDTVLTIILTIIGFVR